MKITGYHIIDNLIANSDGEVHIQAPWLDFLFADKSECIKVLYHLDYSVACLLKMIRMSEEACKELLETTDLQYEGYSFQYIPKRWFAVKEQATRRWAGFSDMSQYEEANLGEYANSRPVASAILAKFTGEEVYQTLENLGLHPKSLTSPISAFNKEALSSIGLPTIDDIPDEVAWYAYQTCKGPWIECFKLGHFENSYDYDIRSAYGSELAKLLDTRYGKWIQSNKYQPDAVYGYCKGTVTIYQPFSPILYKSNTSSFTPMGIWETYLTKTEIDFIYKWNTGNFEIEDGWWWIPDETKIQPLKRTIEHLYAKKEQASTDFEDYIIKRITSGIWGKLLETTEKGFGDLFNPVWAAEVETNTRLKAAELVLVNNLQDHVLSIMVDGVLLNKNIDHPSNLPLSNAVGVSPAPTAESNRAMGTWKLSAHCPSIIVSSGVQAIRDKIHSGNFVLRYDWLSEQIASKPRAKSYKISGLSPVTLAKAFTQKRFSDLGELETISREIDITCETKRSYKIEPRNGRELLSGQYSSVPWDVSIVRGKETDDDPLLSG